jgi:hypothetical protein
LPQRWRFKARSFAPTKTKGPSKKILNDRRRIPQGFVNYFVRFDFVAMTRFPAPWTVEAMDAGFKVVDANG